jgi:hypothetical protein
VLWTFHDGIPDAEIRRKIYKGEFMYSYYKKMVSDKILVILLIVAIILSAVSTIMVLSINAGDLGYGGGDTIIIQGQPEDERGRVALSVGETVK